MCIRDRVHTATSEHAEKGTVPDDFQRFAPSLSVSMQPWQDESLYFRLMYKSTFRLPTFNDPVSYTHLEYRIWQMLYAVLPERM